MGVSFWFGRISNLLTFIGTQRIVRRLQCCETISEDIERPSPMISDETYEVIKANAELLNSAIIYDRDFSYVCCCSPDFLSLIIAHRPTLVSRPLNDLTFCALMAKSLNVHNTCSCVCLSVFTEQTWNGLSKLIIW